MTKKELLNQIKLKKDLLLDISSRHPIRDDELNLLRVWSLLIECEDFIYSKPTIINIEGITQNIYSGDCSPKEIAAEVYVEFTKELDKLEQK